MTVGISPGLSLAEHISKHGSPRLRQRNAAAEQ